MGLGELLVIGVVALLVIGPDRLPSAAAQFGKTMRQFREQAARARRDIDDALGPELQEIRRSVQDIDPRRALMGEIDDVKRAVDSPVTSSTPTERDDKPVPRIDPDAL